MPLESDVPVNPMPSPAQGDINQPSPVTKAQEASWAPYESALGLAEGEGELDRLGRREAPETPSDRTDEQP